MKKPGIQPLKTIAQAEMRAINRSAVLDYLRLSKTASKTELAAQLRISKPTVMRIVDELSADGFVTLLDEKEKGLRRSREMLALDTQHNLVIGVDLGGSHISGVVADIGGSILWRKRASQTWTNAESNFQVLVDFLKELETQANVFSARVLGMAVGVPGIIESKQGLVKIAPSLSWNDFPLMQKLRNHFSLPILIENDVNLAVLGENWFGCGVGIDNLVMVAIGTGIGAGIILDGNLYRGARDSSGEIGYLLPGLDALDHQYPGFGALESLASCKGIADRAFKQLSEQDVQGSITTIDAKDVFEAARQGQEWALQNVRETVDYLSLAIANLSVCFDPELIIIGGGIVDSLDLLIEPIQKRLQNVIPVTPRIAPSKLKDDAPLLGAVVRVFQKCMDYTVVHVV